MYDPNALKIYTDGSAYNNPGHKGGIAAITEYPDNLNLESELIFNEGYLKTTNNRMELRACIRALEFVRKNARRLGINTAIIITDSKYICDNQYIAEHWKKNGWRNEDGRPMENSDLWKEFLLLRIKAGVFIEIKWHQGKSSEILEEVDKLAKNAAKNPTRTDFGFRGGRIACVKTKDKSAATLFPAKNQESVIRIYKKNLVDKEYKITFDLFSVEESRFVAKYYAYMPTKEINKIHRHHCYKVKFNNNIKYPIIETIKILEKCPEVIF